MTRRRIVQLVLVGAAVLFLLGGTVAGACKLTSLDCHIRGTPPPTEAVIDPIPGEPVVPEGFQARAVTTGLKLPTAFDFLPDGRMLVAEKAGVVKVIGRDGRVEKIALDLRRQVNSTLFRGIVAVAVDPDFAANRFIYVVYTPKTPNVAPKGPTTMHVSRFRLSEDMAAGPERVLLGTATPASGSCTDLDPTADCLPSDVDHNGAEIAFGSDGTLFISTGDGGGLEEVEPTAFRAQDVDALGGKILHVTRDGRGLASNPYFDGDTEANRSKVWAKGLRNPFRLTLAPGSGLPVTGDVGWTDVEEIDAAPSGTDLGWPCFEGSDRTRDYESTPTCVEYYASGADPMGPAIALDHPDANSVTGGVFYTADAYPEDYRGLYFFADWLRSWMRAARIDPATGELVSDPIDFGENLGGPVAIRLGSDGALYVLSVNNGAITRIAYTGSG